MNREFLVVGEYEPLAAALVEEHAKTDDQLQPQPHPTIPQMATSLG